MTTDPLRKLAEKQFAAIEGPALEDSGLKKGSLIYRAQRDWFIHTLERILRDAGVVVVDDDLNEDGTPKPHILVDAKQDTIHIEKGPSRRAKTNRQRQAPRCKHCGHADWLHDADEGCCEIVGLVSFCDCPGYEEDE